MMPMAFDAEEQAVSLGRHVEQLDEDERRSRDVGEQSGEDQRAGQARAPCSARSRSRRQYTTRTSLERLPLAARSDGRLSGRSVATTTSQTAPYAASSQKIERQPKCTSSCPPMSGARIGARPITSISTDSMRTEPALIEVVADDGARDDERRAAAERLQKPERDQRARRPASAQPTDEAMNSTRPKYRAGLRPKRSDSGP